MIGKLFTRVAILVLSGFTGAIVKDTFKFFADLFIKRMLKSYLSILL